MPLMLPYGKGSKYPEAPKEVPFSMLSRSMGMTVHTQTLERLVERGGLDPSEMLALMTDQNIFKGSVKGKRLFKIDKHFAIAEINEMLSA